jgi:predicted O-methyltransferase YrrM
MSSPSDINPFLAFAKPGHFYSPIPDLEYVTTHASTIFNTSQKNVPGIILNDDKQILLANKFSEYYQDIPFEDDPNHGLRYGFHNKFFSYGDGIILYSMLRYYRPKRVVEVGSGFTSALMLDVNERFLDGEVEFTFIEPFPERLHSLLKPEDRKACEIIQSPVQLVPTEIFSSLMSGDFLFIDSSHVAKAGSDVVDLLSRALPALKRGVVIHFHDIFWPFQYPEVWVRQGRAWNENYMIQSFLQYNTTFWIEFFNSYMGIHRHEIMNRYLSQFMKNPGGSLWLRRL